MRPSLCTSLRHTELTINRSFDDGSKLLVTVWSKQQDGGDMFLGLISVDVASIVLDDAAYWYPLQGRRGKNDVVSGEVCLAFDHPPYVFMHLFQLIKQTNARKRW
jgi:hypothetical protein